MEPVLLRDLPLAERAEEYLSVDQLAEDSDAVVVVKAVSADSFRTDKWGAFVVDMEITDSFTVGLKRGEMIRVASDISVPSDASNQKLREPLLVAPEGFLLFLKAVDDKGIDADYVPVGWVAGYFQDLGHSEFHRIDPEESKIAQIITVSDVESAVSAE